MSTPIEATPLVASPSREAASPLRRIASDFIANPIAVGGLALLALVVAAAIFAPLISAQNPYDLAQIDIVDSVKGTPKSPAAFAALISPSACCIPHSPTGARATGSATVWPIIVVSVDRSDMSTATR
jgi:hypothetical protein